MITITHGNLLEDKAEALVNTVNTVGVMGKGIALQFRQAYPEMFRSYEKACQAGEVQPGRMHIFERATFENPKFIINFPTKRHWRGHSKIEDIEAGLDALVADLKKFQIKSIALPPLGCGNGGLEWSVVRPVIERALARVPQVEVKLYAPGAAPKVDEIKVNTERAAMTRGRALVVLLLDRYFLPGYRISMLEIQKLAYFLQASGEELRLKFKRDQFGPYAESLHHVLQRIEGHFTRGYGDRTSHARAEIMPLPEGVREAGIFLAADYEALERLDRVSALIDGFESPYGMELLATVHWIAQEFPEAADNPKLAVEKVRAWNQRKAEIFSERDIQAAWDRLNQKGWLSAVVMAG